MKLGEMPRPCSRESSDCLEVQRLSLIKDSGSYRIDLCLSDGSAKQRAFRRCCTGYSSLDMKGAARA